MRHTRPRLVYRGVYPFFSFLLVCSFVFTPLVDLHAQESVIAPEDTSDSITSIAPPSTTQPEDASFPADADVPLVDSSQSDGVASVKEEPESSLLDSQMASAAALVSDTTFVPVGNTFEIQEPQADLATGALTYEYPITVPPGRNGVQPDLKLTYNSQRTLNENIVGYAWTVNIPFIQRLNKIGSNKLYPIDGFEGSDYFESSMDGELASTSAALGTTTYAARVENGSFLTYEFANDYWLVTDKQGTSYKFGVASTSRQDDPSDSSKIFKWMLTEVRDTNGNYISYEYVKDKGQIYPSKVVYTGNGVTPGIFEVEFLRENRADQLVSFSEGFGATTTQRISEVDVKVNGNWVRKYALGYTIGNNGVRSLLSSITESGRDEQGTVVTLPPTTFSYTQQSTPGLQVTTSIVVEPANLSSSSTYTAIALDVNGDALPDILSLKGAGSGTSKVFINKGGGNGWYSDVGATWTLPSVTFKNGSSIGFAFGDINGDGYPDFLTYQPTTGKKVYINNRINGWTEDSSWVLPDLYYPTWDSSRGGTLTDVNGDGLADIWYCDGSSSKKVIFWNTGSGWYEGPWDWYMTPQCYNFGTAGNRIPVIMDANADGLADVMYGPSSGSPASFLETNASQLNWSRTNAPVSTSTVFSNNSGVNVLGFDVNGDNLPDLIANNLNYSNASPWPRVDINTGTTTGPWIASSTWQFPDYITQPNSGGQAFADVDGDGMIDFLRQVDSTKYVYRNNGRKTDLLARITYPAGGSTSAVYKHTPQYLDGTTILNPNLPFGLDTVSELGTSDGFGQIATSTFVYQGGSFYASSTDRRLAGFSLITKTDPDGNVTKTYFHQGNASDSTHGEYQDSYSKIGKIYRQEFFDSSAHLYKTVINKWDKYTEDSKRDFIKLARTVTSMYDGNSGHKDTAEEYSYDNANGNLTQHTSWGDVVASDDGSFTDTGSDKGVETITYASSTAGVIGLPYTDTLVDQGGGKVRESRTYYDNFTSAYATKGNPTKQERWKTGSAYVTTQIGYNTFGLATSTTDERGKVTTYGYDSYNLYPATTTNPLGQSTGYVYDYSLGKPRQITTPNGLTYSITLDGLDRTLSESIPDPSSPATAVTKRTYAYTDTSGAISVQTTDYLTASLSRATVQFFDGLNRLVQERKQGESKYNVRDIAYTSRGLTYKESLPYSSTGASKASATTDSALYSSYTYDALNRVRSVANAVGTTAYAYDDRVTTVTDANGKIKRLIADAYDNLSQVEEHDLAASATTTYAWDLNKNLLSIEDPSANRRAFTYDGLGRRLTAQDLHAIGDTSYGTWTYGYDDAGNLTQVITPRALTINYTYDDLNRPLTEDYTGGAGTEVTYTYDACTYGIGKLCSAIALGSATSTYTYDGNGNVASEARTIGGNLYTTTYSYDQQGNQSNITYPDASEIRYTYNAAGQIDRIEQKENGGSFTDTIADIDYSPQDLMSTTTYPNGTVSARTYDSDHAYRLSNILTTNATSTRLQDMAYTYDAVGNITQIDDSSETNAGKNVIFTYDDLNRLLTASTTSTANGPGFKQVLTYSPIGNLLTKSDVGTYSYLGSSGMNYANPHAPTSVGSTTLGYDADGNLTSYGTDLYEWDYRNRMASSTVSGLGATYGYDHTNQRVLKTMNSITTVYPNQYFEKANATTTKYIWAGGELVATINGNGVSTSTEYSHSDHLGSTNVTTDSNGDVTSVLDYLPFGSERISTGDKLPGRGYLSQFTDREQNLSYLQSRYYSSDRGQFISQDPVFWEIGQTSDGKMILANPQLQNSYNYSGNNPITGKDPTGRVVYLYSRPVDMPWGYVGAHSFVEVVPDNPATVGSIANVDTSKSFTLSGLPNNGRLQKFANIGSDPSFTSCGVSCGSSRVTVAPPQGVTSEQFDANVVNSYNNLPSDLGKYWFWGSPKILGMPNSNNFTTSLLTNAGVSKDALREYQNTLSQGNGKITPGFGTSALSPSYASQLKSQLTSIRNQLRDIVKKLKGN